MYDEVERIRKKVVKVKVQSREEGMKITTKNHSQDG
jgi:hypothetical protein